MRSALGWKSEVPGVIFGLAGFGFAIGLFTWRLVREQNHPAPLPGASTTAERKPLVDACNLLVEVGRSHYAKVRKDVSKFLGVSKWEDIRTEDIPRALEFVQL